jgi:protein-tyrosine phosphatase
MIDLHCHILPSIDDGPSDIEQSIRMAKIAAIDGIKKIVATPHITDGTDLSERIRNHCEILIQKLQDLNVPIEILPGGELPAVTAPTAFKKYTINQTNYVLIEFPHSYLPQSARETLFNLVSAGLFPIISHPERNSSVVQNPNRLLELLDANIFVQITAGSLTGNFGRNEQQCARYLLKKGVVDILATDAHDDDYRRPELSSGLKIAAKLIGKTAAGHLVNRNPSAIINGELIHGKNGI